MALSATLGTLVTAVQTELQDPTGEHYSSTNVKLLLNQAVVDFLMTTKIRRKTTTVTVNAGQAEYDLSTVTPSIVEVLRVALPLSEDQTLEHTLEFLPQEVLDRQDMNWRQRTGNPWAYTRFDQTPLRLRLYPEPTGTYTAIADASAAVWSGYYGLAGALAGLTDPEFDSLYGSTIGAAYKYGSMRVDYIAGATELTSDSDDLLTTNDIPVEHQDGVLWYAVARCCELSVPIAQQKKAKGYWEKYQGAVANASQLANRQMQSKPARSVTGWRF